MITALKKIINNIFKTDSEVIRKFQNINDLLITYEELEKISLNKVIQIAPELEGAIECTRISSTNKNTLMFTVTMKKNQLWEKHHHDCYETCVVYKGKLTDAITGHCAGPAEFLNFEPYQPHYVVAEKDSVFYVEFKKPEN